MSRKYVVDVQKLVPFWKRVPSARNGIFRPTSNCIRVISFLVNLHYLFMSKFVFCILPIEFSKCNFLSVFRSEPKFTWSLSAFCASLPKFAKVKQVCRICQKSLRARSAYLMLRDLSKEAYAEQYLTLGRAVGGGGWKVRCVSLVKLGRAISRLCRR